MTDFEVKTRRGVRNKRGIFSDMSNHGIIPWDPVGDGEKRENETVIGLFYVDYIMNFNCPLNVMRVSPSQTGAIIINIQYPFYFKLCGCPLLILSTPRYFVEKGRPDTTGSGRGPAQACMNYATADLLWVKLCVHGNEIYIKPHVERRGLKTECRHQCVSARYLVISRKEQVTAGTERGGTLNGNPVTVSDDEDGLVLDPVIFDGFCVYIPILGRPDPLNDAPRMGGSGPGGGSFSSFVNTPRSAFGVWVKEMASHAVLYAGEPP